MKLVKAVMLVGLMAVGSAMAGEYASLEYYDEHNRTTKADNIKEALVVGTKVGSTDYSLKMENSQAEFGNGSISQGLELRVKQSFGPMYLGGRLGERVTSTTHFSHYAVDLGIKVPMVSTSYLDIGGRYRNAFDTSNEYQTTRAHVAVGYGLTKQDTVAVRWSRSWGDDEKDSWRLQYTRSF